MIWTAIVTFESRIILESFNFCNTISLEQLLQNFRRVNFINLLRVKCQVAFVFYRCMYLYPVFSCIFSDFFLKLSCIVLHLRSKLSCKIPRTVLYCPALSHSLTRKILYTPWFENLICFPQKLNRHIQDEALYNGRMLGILLLVCSLHCLENFSPNMVV